MDVFERIRDIRKRRGLTQEEVASWFGISKQSWGAKEKGREGGFGPKELTLFLEKTAVDARYLFGQLATFEEADLRNPAYRQTNLTMELLEEVREYRSRNQPPATTDSLAQVVANERSLRDLVEKLIAHRGLMPKVEGYLDALVDALAERSREGDQKRA